jgi:hypothetical protein
MWFTTDFTEITENVVLFVSVDPVVSVVNPL